MQQNQQSNHMDDVLAALTAAGKLAPELDKAIPLIAASFKGLPLSAAEGKSVAFALNSAGKKVPEIVPLATIVRAQFNGETYTDSEKIAVQTAHRNILQRAANQRAEAEAARRPAPTPAAAPTGADHSAMVPPQGEAHAPVAAP